MKRILLFVFMIIASACMLQAQTYFSTATGTLPATVGDSLTAGDMVRDTTSNKIALVTKLQANKYVWGGGTIEGVKLEMDSANAALGSFTVIALGDTAGIGATLVAHHAAFELTDSISSKAILYDTITLATIGTQAGGATKAVGFLKNISIPYDLKKTGKAVPNLYWLIVANGKYVCKSAGKIRLTVAYKPD